MPFKGTSPSVYSPPASLCSPGKAQAGTGWLGPSSSPSQPHSCCHWGLQLGPGGRGAEKPAPSPVGVWGLGCNLWLPAWLQSTQQPPRPPFQTSEKAQDEHGLLQYSCTFPTQAPEGSGLQERKGGKVVSSLPGEAGALTRWPRLPTPAFHSYQIIAALLPTDPVTLCTF